MRNDRLDNLKIFLTFLVVFHHAALAYTPSSDWPIIDLNQTMALIPMLAINASFFMGLFFFISGIFVPISLERNGPIEFIIKKLYRLIFPAVLISLFIPVFLYFLKNNPPSFYIFIDFYYNFLSKDFTFGHGWFLIQLFIFSWIYIFLKKIFNKCYINFNSMTTTLCLGIFLGSITYIIDIKFPINYWVLFHLFEIYHLPQYIMLFFLGCVYSNRNFNLSSKQATYYLAFSLVLIVWYILNFNCSCYLEKFEVVWSSLLAIFLSFGLCGLFINHVTVSNQITKLLAQNSFGIYIVHLFIIIVIQKLLLTFAIGSLLKFFITGVTGYFLSFGIMIIYRFLLIQSKIFLKGDRITIK